MCTRLLSLRKYCVSFDRYFKTRSLAYKNVQGESQAANEIDLKDEPVKYSTSDAAKWKTAYSTSGELYFKYPRIQPPVVAFSLAAFLIYFCILREENDLDDWMRELETTVPIQVEMAQLRAEIDMERKKKMYSCESCRTKFTGIIPYQLHMNSEKHRKKMEVMSNQRTTSEPVTKPTSISDPYIEQFHGEFKCTLCCTILNSHDQVVSHINGKKHKKSMTGKGDFPNPNYYSSQPIAFEAKTDATNQYSFIFHNIKIENPLSEVKIFDVDDPIVF